MADGSSPTAGPRRGGRRARTRRRSRREAPGAGRRPHRRTERELVRRHAAGLALLGPLPVGYVHGDFQERNWLHDPGTGALAVVDLERARPHAAVLDVVRLACGPWARLPELRTAFFEGFGRELTATERTALRCLSALDAASAIAWGVPHDDKEVVERGHATLARLVRGDFV
ncbi:phosphotransferase [Streptomyces chiangmaiensis]|uniref:phosphotransferase n=1 Tax=Streptomyces chiangmaiensis TaxID=766497 RepID=UPI0031ED4645